MITPRPVKQCGHADFGWLRSRYTFSFNHYFDPKMMGYAALRVLNQDVLAPGAALQPRTFPRVDVMNIILAGEAEYRDSRGNHIQAAEGDIVLLATRDAVSYSEHNPSADVPLTRLQLWLNTCPERENDEVQRLHLDNVPHQIIASPEGESGSLRLRQQVWIHHVMLQPGEEHSLPLLGTRAYVQSIHGGFSVRGLGGEANSLSCGDGAFINDEQRIILQAETPLRALVIDLPA